MHYVIQFDGRGKGGVGYKPTQKWWLKLKLPIERTSQRGGGREWEREGRVDTKNMEQTEYGGRIREGKIDPYRDGEIILFLHYL